MSVKKAKAIVEEFVRSKRNEVLSIQGGWGVGKTYFWSKCLKEIAEHFNIEHKNYSYVSLFGINSIEALKNAIIANQVISTSIGADSSRSASQLYARLKGIMKSLSSNKKIQDYVSGWGSDFAFWFVDDSLICFDDLERGGDTLPIKDVFGLASLLKEQRNCDVVFILNYEALENKTDFMRHNEKVIDLSITFEPEPLEAFDLVFSPTHPFYNSLKECCLTLEITNIRILQKIKRLHEQLIKSIGKTENPVLVSIVKSIVLFTWVYFDKGHKFGNTLSLEFLNKFERILLYLKRNVRNEEVSPDELAVYQLLERYGYISTDDFDRQLMEFIQKGYVDDDRFFSELEIQNETAKAGLGKEKFSEAWDIYNYSFDDNEDLFVDELTKSFKVNRKYLPVESLRSTVEILRQLERDSAANHVIDEYLAVHAESLEDQHVRSRIAGALDDTYFQAELNKRLKTTAKAMSVDALVDKIGKANLLSDDEWDFLASSDVESYRNAFREDRSDFKYFRVRALLDLQKLALTNEAHQQVVAKTKEALRLIASTSRINQVRIINMFQLDFSEPPPS